MLRHLLCLSLLLLSEFLAAQPYWSPVAEPTIAAQGERRIVPQTYRSFRLDRSTISAVLAAAPDRYASPGQETVVVLSIPAPDGDLQRFRVYETAVMAPALQARYPEIRTFSGTGIDDPSATLKCDMTPWGFHAMVMRTGGDHFYIDPYQHGDADHYVVYYKKDYLPGKHDGLPCLTEPEAGVEIKPGAPAPAMQTESAGDCQLRRYRLALACTGEYAAFHGGTKPLVLAAMITTMNRVNGVFENEFAVTMQLVPNNDTLIFLNSSSDPYTNNSGSTMLGQNISTCNARIGLANYDIGHVFSTGGGGIAGLGVVCTNNKARGVTGGGAPVGDPFDIDYVAHEMGHQFGANHTQNNNCNRVASASMEPGSASTIMGYAGICSPNVQNNSDDYFHAISIQEVSNFINNGNGNTCPVKTVTGNNAPTVDAGPNYVIPKSTPFVLTAVGNDIDGDSLSYCWEQMDPQFATMPPVSTSTTGPLFRSYKAVPSPSRYFPRLPDLVNNFNSTWEELPGVARNMNFRVTVRDNFAGAGCTDEDNTLITVAGTAGPFVVTAPNTAVTWVVSEPRTVTWDVAGTDLAPVNCAAVDILLSQDGGFTYPHLLAAGVPNSGSFDLLVPNLPSNSCRIMVRSGNNVFFDISNSNFKIELPPAPTFLISTSLSAATLCAGDELQFTLDAISILGFNDTLAVTLSGAPAGVNVVIAPDSLPAPGSVSIALNGFTPDMAGIYTLDIAVSSDTTVRHTAVQMTLLPTSIVGIIAPEFPAPNAYGVPATTSLIWHTIPFAELYDVELADNPSFQPGSLVFSQTTSDSSVAVSGLQLAGVYYWRVRATNSCGTGEFSPFQSFQVGGVDCNKVFTSTDVPVVIDPDNVNTVSSLIDVPDDAVIADVDVSLMIAHTWVGDIDARLVSPSGDTVVLFDRPGVPQDQFGCQNDNLELVLDDEAALDADALESSCNAIAPAISGAFQSLEALSKFDNKSVTGSWHLWVTDNVADDGGQVTDWSLTFCYLVTTPTATLLNNSPLEVPFAGSAAMSDANLSAELSGGADQGVFTLLALPASGALTLNGTSLGIGDQFTQADIDAGLVGYTHNGDAALTDAALLSYYDQNNGAWLPEIVFNLVVLQNTLAVDAAALGSILCAGTSTGQIEVMVTGGYAPFTFSLNGGPEQMSGVFDGLPAGSYTAVVTDVYGFTAETNTVELDEPVALALSPAVNGAQVTANGSGGTGALTYSLDGQNFQVDPVFENVPNGFYTVVVRDENGCEAQAEVIVAVGVLLATVHIDNNVSCFGANDGALSVNVAGGVQPYSYSLDGIDFQPEAVFTGLPAGTYSITIRDDQGAEYTTSTVTISEPDAILASADVNLNEVIVTASGGTGALEYSIDGVNFQAGATFSALTNGDYTVTVRDETGCTQTVTVTVAVPDLAIIAIEASDLLCFGDLGTLAITAEGGIPPYAYSLDGGLFQSDSVFTGVSGGMHTIIIRDAFVSMLEIPFVLNEPDMLTLGVSVLGNDVSAVQASGGTAPYSFSYDPGLPVDLMNIPNGTYSITATDANGCTAVNSFTIDYTPLSATSETIDPDCNGDTNGQISVEVAGGVSPYLYSIDGGNFQPGNTFTGLSGGTYTVTIQDAAGDSYTLPVTVTDPAAISATAAVSADTITVTASGGTGALLYSLNGLLYQTSPEFLNVPNGTYTIRVKDVNGCITLIQNVVVNVVGTIDPAAAWGLQVLPNPGNGLFQIIVNQPPVGDLQVEVYDVIGRRLAHKSWAPQGGALREYLDLQFLPQGNYVLRLTDGRVSGAVLLQIAH